ncbi:MAG TPA: tyrosine--tRNA ligase [Candidatus Dojkabacteria bacterium]
MKFRVEKNIFDRFPNGHFGALYVTGINNSKYPENLRKKIQEIFEQTLETYKSIDLQNTTNILLWRELFTDIGLDKSFLPSHEALLKRLVNKKSLPEINPLVDIYNAFSVKESIPIGGHKISETKEVVIGETKGSEKFRVMNSEQIENVEKGEIAYLSEDKILTRHFVWRQSEYSKIDNDTSNIFIPIDDPYGLKGREELFILADNLVSLINVFLGGTAKFAIVDKFNSDVDFDMIEEFIPSKVKFFDYREINITSDEKLIDELLDRGISQILPDKESFKKKLMSGKRITIYQGYDPSASSLHIGNAIGMRLLEKFRRLGHHVVFLIGTGTGKIGDPTDKTATRKVLTDKQIEENIQGWIEQATQILDFNNEENPVEIVQNGDWLKPMTLDKFLNLGNKVTVQQLLERDMFKKRLEEGKPISVSEMLYPILQGYDSVVMSVDAEFGGNDQLFNMMMGRTLEGAILNKEKYVLTGKLLADPNGIKMGKSLGNVINLTDSPEDIYGKVMTFTDGMIAPAFEILTDVSMKDVKEIEDIVSKASENPMTYKKVLAFEVTKWIKGELMAKDAQEYFEQTIQNQEVPQNIEHFVFAKLESKSIIDILVSTKLVESRGEAKRLIKQGGVEVDSKKILELDYKIENENLPKIIKVGKRNWMKLV